MDRGQGHAVACHFAEAAPVERAGPDGSLGTRPAGA